MQPKWHTTLTIIGTSFCIRWYRVVVVCKQIPILAPMFAFYSSNWNLASAVITFPSPSTTTTTKKKTKLPSNSSIPSHSRTPHQLSLRPFSQVGEKFCFFLGSQVFLLVFLHGSCQKPKKPLCECQRDVITAEARFNSRSKMRTWVRELELLTHNNNNNTVPSDAKTGGNDCECCVSFCLHLVFWSTNAGFLRCMGLFCFVLQGLARCLNCH